MKGNVDELFAVLICGYARQSERMEACISVVAKSYLNIPKLIFNELLQMKLMTSFN